VEDLASLVREKEKDLDFEPGELEELEERLAAIVRLNEKYGRASGGIPAFEARARAASTSFYTARPTRRGWSRKGPPFAARHFYGRRVVRARKKGAKEVEALVVSELALLSMKPPGSRSSSRTGALSARTAGTRSSSSSPRTPANP
jgi:DNA repair ATPase RecN